MEDDVASFYWQNLTYSQEPKYTSETSTLHISQYSERSICFQWKPVERIVFLAIKGSCFRRGEYSKLILSAIRNCRKLLSNECGLNYHLIPC
ncbi:hypothetical protein VNO77_39467 [Canavalia gladiata]|uniref:Uncharacterized protein n=1 Tax=Canavalia gladiata TaxID=3824 RepID=A0AAN9PZT4_CANGL